ncbi:MAG: hypothetical protein COY40_02615 [Alphaproteobacteria bacterium CG_4_10_14_0_8_um_filter_53_9]|nr:MAG: hypothetical protein COY40_02615 [Alphaproteobacteria bacterium CG_4_10_14_0_8_um_filter_53_9]
MSFAESYVGKVRAKWGQDELLMPGVCALIFNTEGKLLLGYRKDHKAWCHMGGSPELGEDAETCLRREIEEEFGLTDIGEIEPIALVSEHKATYREYPGGDKFASWTILCVLRHIDASAIDAPEPDDEEHDKLAWFDMNDLPADEDLFVETRYSLQAWQRYQETKKFVLC